MLLIVLVDSNPAIINCISCWIQFERSDLIVLVGVDSVMDWQGQKLAEQLMQILLLIAAVVAFVVGYTTASFRTMMLIYAGGVGVTTLITVPNWPFFNRHPLKWLEPSEAEKHPKPEVVVSSKKKSSNK